MLNLVEIDLLVLQKKMKIWKVNDSNEDDNDVDDPQRTHLDQKSSLYYRLSWA